MAGDVNWVEELMGEGFDDPSGRVIDVECDEIPAGEDTIGRITVRFTIEDYRQDSIEVGGKVFLPSSLRDDPTQRLPLVFSCGYEVPDEMAPGQVARGRIAATTLQIPEGGIHPGAWAIARGPNHEIVLAHLLRGLPFVDPSAFIYAGGSAGGYACLMAAAAAFPLAIATPAVPLTNLAYCAAYIATNIERLFPDGVPTEPSPPQAMLMQLGGLVPAWRSVFGDDFDAPAWLAHSPVGQLDRLTCPVASFFTTVDILVPIDQVDRSLAAAVRAASPGGLEFAAEKLTDAAASQVKLLEALGDRADVRVVPIGDEVPLLTETDLTLLAPHPPISLPDAEPAAGRWLVTVVDEGEPVFGPIHFKHAVQPDFEPVIERALEAGIGVDQLTPTKLDQLLDRYRGVEWLAPGFPHLDRPEAERADVERGLRTYCGVSAAHAERFAKLYAAAAPDRRVLPDELVAALGE